jgi:hypothetical protein
VYVRKELLPVVQPVVVGWMAFEGTDDFTRLTDYDPRLRADVVDPSTWIAMVLRPEACSSRPASLRTSLDQEP